MKVCLLVEVLRRKPQRHIENSHSARILIRRIASERLGLIPLPDGGAGSISDEPGRVEMIDVDKMRLLAGLASDLSEKILSLENIDIPVRGVGKIVFALHTVEDARLER